jgi:hypothetical protein
MFYAQIKEQEQNFILPAVNVESTIAGFMKKLYYFWPGDLKCFIEHLVAYGMLTSDANMIDYAFKKSEEILPKLVERATPMDLMTIDFVKTVKNRIKQA